MRIISTPNGLTNKFADLWLRAREIGLTAESSFGYFKSKVTIHDAIAAGLPLDAAELEAGLNDADAWPQEYLCEFMDSSTVLFPYELIAAGESEEATETGVNLAELTGARRGQLFAGIDFGRKQHLTVCWILERVPARNRSDHLSPAFSPLPAERDNISGRWNFITRQVVTIQNTPTPQQLEILLPRLQRCNRICLDATGAGVGLGDYLVQRFGQWIPSGHSTSAAGARGRVELCQFTTALKAELFPRLRTAFEQRVLRIPISREIREDLHAIQRSVTQNGSIAYRAPQSADGHSDRTTALALALRAAQHAPVSTCARSVAGPVEEMDYERQSPVTFRLAGSDW